jgi:NFU1 iron-sulfur cluster scaffold homolog, mitochondrial
MFIATEETPNPATLKFLPGRAVMGEKPVADFPEIQSAARSPLATSLFALPGVAGVFLGSDFITITKTPDTAWAALKPIALGAVMEHFVKGLPIIDAGSEEVATESTEEDSEIVAQIKDLIETRVRPAVASDGGDIVFQGFDSGTGTVFLQLRGACSGCPSSTLTLRNGIETMLRQYVPEVNAVESI